jgi:hypothetical protein
MPHPDYQIVDVPLRCDQVSALMALIDETVATGRGATDFWAGPMAQLLGSLPKDTTHLRPGPMHWLWEVERERKR